MDKNKDLPTVRGNSSSGSKGQPGRCQNDVFSCIHQKILLEKKYIRKYKKIKLYIKI